MKSVRLLTTLSQLELLHKQVNDTKATKVYVDAQGLRALLIDHSVLARALKENSTTKVLEPSRLRERLS